MNEKLRRYTIVGLYEYAKKNGLTAREAAVEMEAQGYVYDSDNPSTGEIEYRSPVRSAAKQEE